MEKKNLKIIYMGTPDFAVEPLKHLVENGYNILVVITMTDKPSGSGHQLQQSPDNAFGVPKTLMDLKAAKRKEYSVLSNI